MTGIGERLHRLEEPRMAARLASLLAVLLVVAAFGMLVARAVTLDFHNRQPTWVVDAIPAVLSELYYGHQKRYTTLESVHRRFFARVEREVATARPINAAMRRLIETANEDPGTAILLLGPDDKGIVDLIKGGFLLFGARAESTVTIYVALLLLSCALYVGAFWRWRSALLLLVAFLGMFYLVMPMIMHNGQLRSILALRALPILSMVACLHVLLFMATSLHARPGIAQIILMALQVVLITFTIHLRSTTLWQVATILGFGMLVLAASRVKRTGTWALLPMGLMVVGYLGLQQYHALALPEEYRRGDEIATRVFWHNIFTGFAYHPELRDRFQIRLDDVSIMVETGRYLAETGQQDRWHEMNGDAPNFAGFKFALYDPAVREMLVARCSVLVRECLETFVWYKPVSLMQNLAWLYGFKEEPPDLDVADSAYFGDILKRQILGMSQGLDAHGLRAYLWTPRVLLLVLPFVVLLLVESRSRTWAALAAGLALALGSTLTTVIGYASPHTIAESAIAFGMVIYLGLGVLLAAGLKRLMGQRKRALAPAPRASLPATGPGTS